MMENIAYFNVSEAQSASWKHLDSNDFYHPVQA